MGFNSSNPNTTPIFSKNGFAQSIGGGNRIERLTLTSPSLAELESQRRKKRQREKWAGSKSNEDESEDDGSEGIERKSDMGERMILSDGDGDEESENGEWKRGDENTQWWWW